MLNNCELFLWYSRGITRKTLTCSHWMTLTLPLIKSYNSNILKQSVLKVRVTYFFYVFICINVFGMISIGGKVSLIHWTSPYMTCYFVAGSHLCTVSFPLIRFKDLPLILPYPLTYWGHCASLYSIKLIGFYPWYAEMCALRGTRICTLPSLAS